MDSTADQVEPTGTPSPASSRTIAPADHPTTSAATPATLTFVLPATDKDGTDHFAVTTFPESYEVRFFFQVRSSIRSSYLNKLCLVITDIRMLLS